VKITDSPCVPASMPRKPECDAAEAELFMEASLRFEKRI
jgi:hypothetical protein